MKASTYISDKALPQGQHGSSDQPPSPDSFQVITEASPEEGTPRYVCSPCRTSYAQRQGLTRHIREAHNPSLCLLCEFKWGRRYEYRNHLRTEHPGVDPNMILGKAPRPRRRATIRTKHAVPQQPLASLPAVEQDGQNWAESQAYSLVQPSPAGARITSVSPHAVLPVDYNAHGSFLGLPSAHQGASAATHTFNPETPPMRFTPFSDMDIDAALNSIFTNSTF